MHYVRGVKKKVVEVLLSRRNCRMRLIKEVVKNQISEYTESRANKNVDINTQINPHQPHVDSHLQ